MKIQCLIKRKGGSKPSFGHHAATAVEYHFKPIDPNDEQSPHVCDVEDEDHIASFLAVPSVYRVYVEGKPVLSVPPTTKELDTSKLKNLYDDLLSVNPEQVDGVWLEGFAREVLGIDPKSQAALKECLINDYNGTVTGRPATNTLIRSILVARIAQEKEASDLHVQGDKTNDVEGAKDE